MYKHNQHSTMVQKQLRRCNWNLNLFPLLTCLCFKRIQQKWMPLSTIICTVSQS